MRRVFQGRVSNRAGSSRGYLSGHADFQARGAGRGSFGQRPPFQDQRDPSPFFSSRGGQWRSRSFRGNPTSRRPFGKFSSDWGFYGPLCRGQTPTCFSCLEPHHIRPMGADHSQFFCMELTGSRACFPSPPPPPPIPMSRSATLARLAKEFWSSCLSRDIMVQAEYLPGLSNVRVDWNSRYLSDGSDWQLDPEVFLAISDMWGLMTIDLFVSWLNRQLTRFYSWRPDPEAVAVDAFLQDWSSSRLYAFSPFAMVPRTLLRVRRHRADLVLVVPFWGSQDWYPTSLGILVEVPVFLPSLVDLLRNPQDLLLLGVSLWLLACRISGHLELSMAFRRRLDSYWTTHGLPAPESLIGQPGEIGLAGAWNGTWIPFLHL
ncbi:uncharacterized protein LOC122940106 [Bufo gargarizans]|uniref:uncharacterized protein LOC122940106 n=1 Tax=Bufo gargarizans TaxID=30331 RepID=UPI001CF35D0F|nr:uncharacterized protein LOC122940106 [Bufo gargarizans]